MKSPRRNPLRPGRPITATSPGEPLHGRALACQHCKGVQPAAISSRGTAPEAGSRSPGGDFSIARNSRTSLKLIRCRWRDRRAQGLQLLHSFREPEPSVRPRTFRLGFAPRARDASVRAPLDHCDHTLFLVHGRSGGLASERACLPRPAERRGFIRPRVFLIAPRSALRPEVLVQDLAGTVAGHPSNPWPCDRSRCSSHNPSASAVSLESWQSPQSMSPPITGIPRTHGSAAHNTRIGPCARAGTWRHRRNCLAACDLIPDHSRAHRDRRAWRYGRARLSDGPRPGGSRSLAGCLEPHRTDPREDKRLADSGVDVRRADRDLPETLKTAFKGTEGLSLGPSMANVEHRIAQHANALAAAGACGVRWTVADFSAARDDFAIPITPYLV